MAARQVSSGNNNITVNLSGPAINCIVEVYLIQNPTSDTPSDTDKATGTTSAAVTLTIPANSVTIVAEGWTSSTAATWTNATEDDDESIEFTGSQRQISVASRADVSAPGSTTITASHGATSRPRAIVGATWA